MSVVFVDGMAGPVNVEERDPLVSGLNQLDLAEAVSHRRSRL
jgi:hypothetical protein